MHQGIMRVSKITNLLIVLDQALCGKIGVNYFNSMGYNRFAKGVKTAQCAVSVPKIVAKIAEPIQGGSNSQIQRCKFVV